MADFYSVLGVDRKATAKEIKDAYRRLARRYHPDVNRKDARAEEKFKGINEAYQVLSNSKTRKDYDQFGEHWKHAEQIRNAGPGAGFGGEPGGQDGGFQWFQGGGGPGGIEDLLRRFGFDRPGGSGPRGPFEPAAGSQQVPIEISLEEAFRGTTRLVSFDREAQCEACHGTGRRGRGACSACGGTGVTARPTRLEVKIPAGIDDGGRVRIRPSAGAELIFVVRVKPDPRFRRQGADLYEDVEVPFTDAILGGEVRVATMTGQVALKIPAGTVAGRTFRVAGKGMPRVGDGEPGSLFARVLISVPRDLTDDERRLVTRLKEMREGARVS